MPRTPEEMASRFVLSQHPHHGYPGPGKDWLLSPGPARLLCSTIFTVSLGESAYIYIDGKPLAACAFIRAKLKKLVNLVLENYLKRV